MANSICPRCGQKQVDLSPATGCLFCGRGTTQIYDRPLVSPPPAAPPPAPPVPATIPLGATVTVPFADLLNAARAQHAHAEQMRASQASSEANLIDAILVQLLFPVVSHITGDAAWLQTARRVLDVATPLPIDALIAPERSGAAVRLQALLVVPDITTLVSLTQVQQYLRDAIQRGGPAYNAGDVQGCALRYWVTAQALVVAPVVKRSAQVAQVLTPLRQAVNQPQAPIGENDQARRDYAWMLRRALDSALAVA